MAGLAVENVGSNGQLRLCAEASQIEAARAGMCTQLQRWGRVVTEPIYRHIEAAVVVVELLATQALPGANQVCTANVDRFKTLYSLFQLSPWSFH